jgi:hypothetical protein
MKKNKEAQNKEAKPLFMSLKMFTVLAHLRLLQLEIASIFR